MTAQIDFASIGDQIGQEIAVSPWLDVTQERINAFAEATDDRQWIHVDPARAAAASPFKSTIAHGFLTLSLVSVLLRTAMTFSVKMAINYGLNRVRFVSAVPVGSRIRGHFTPGSVEQVVGGVQVTWTISIEREGQDKPACVAEWIVRYYL
jgi:acyl dehydratase